MQKKKLIPLLIVVLLLAGLALLVSMSKESEPPGIPATSSKANRQEVCLYFADDQAMYLVPEKRTVQYNKDIPLPDAIINELIAGPGNKDSYPTIPAGTRLLSIEINDKIAYVDFSEEIRTKHGGGSSGETMTITSIVNSLTELDSINKVQILIEGEKQETLVGHWGTSEPLERDEKIIKQ